MTEKKVRDLLELIEDRFSLEAPVGDGESEYGDLIEDVNADLQEESNALGMRSEELSEASRAEPEDAQRHRQAGRARGEPPQTLEQVGGELGSPGSAFASSSHAHWESCAPKRPSSTCTYERRSHLRT